MKTAYLTAIGALILTLLTGCRTHKACQTCITADTIQLATASDVYQWHQLIDTTTVTEYIHDSVYVTQIGDTIIKEATKIIYRDRNHIVYQRDTISQTADSIRTETKYITQTVATKPTTWQKVTQYTGTAVIALLAILALCLVGYAYTRRVIS